MRDNSLNILLLASWYPSMEHPTAGSFVQEQAHMLRDYGHQVTVIHPFMLGTFASSIKKRSTVSFAQEDGIRVLRVGVVPPVPFFRGVSYAYCFQRVREAMNRFQLDPKDFAVIHSHAMFMGGVIGYMLSKKNNLPQVHTEHTSGLIFNPKQYTNKDLSLLRNTYAHCHKVLFVSQFAMKHTLSNIELESREHVVVLPNIVDASYFTSLIRPFSKATSFKFLIIGNFIPIKNHRLLLEAFSLVQKQYPAVGLSIAGNGPLEQELRALCESLKLENVYWLPRLNRAEVKVQMAAHQAILSTSKVETFGLTIAEAQAMGKPVVVTDSGGVRDIVTQETGIVTEGSSEAFSKGMLQLIQSYVTYDPETIRQSAKRRFSSEVIVEQLNEIYRSLHEGTLYL
jgi:glycosyltransferase involved in cell wall biosynthesis